MDKELEQVVADIKESVATEVKETVMPAITKEVFEQMKADLPNRKKELFGEDVRDETKDAKEAKEKSAEFIKAHMAGDSAQLKSLSTGTDADGGYLVPENFSNEIIRIAPTYGVVRRDARNYGVSDAGNSTKLPTIGSVSVSRVSEKGAIPAVQPTTGQISIDIKKLAGITPMANELLQDAGPDTVDILTMLYAEAFAKAEDTWGFAGLAAGEGIFQNADVPVLTLDATNTSYTDVTLDDMLAALDLLDDDAAGNAKWYMTFSMFNHFRGLKDADGRYLLQHPTDGRPATIWNLPIQLVRVMPRTTDGSQAGKKFLAVGDLSYMLFADKKEYSFNISQQATIKDVDGTTPINLWEQDMSAVRVIERIDIQLAEAAKAFAVVATAAA
jgi:HK97 family phage major capsid protein